MARKRRQKHPQHSKHARRRAKHTERHARHYDFEQGAENFGHEIEGLGKRFEDMAMHVRLRTFTGLVIGTVFSIVVLFFSMWLLVFVNAFVNSKVLAGILDFLKDNQSVLTMLFVMSAFIAWLGKVYTKAGLMLLIVLLSLSNTATVWFIANIIEIANLELGVPALHWLTSGLLNNLFFIFIAFILLTMLKYGRKGHLRESIMHARELMMKKTEKGQGEIHRLYRSGNDRILGGVCGGIADYLGVDPVIIRLLWVLLVLMGGAGVLLYLIAWIIIPRNPKHTWK